MKYEKTTSCRSCGGATLWPVLDLGWQPLANDFRRINDQRVPEKFPLGLVCCGRCSLVQLTGIVSPEEMFGDYLYFSSFSTTMLDSAAEISDRLTTDLGLGPTDLVVEVASNDGYLLKNYLGRAVTVLGIDPAENVAEVAVARGVPTIIDYFGERVALGVVETHGTASVIHANNVLAHVPDINDFVSGIATLLAEEGTAVIETPYLVEMVENCEFDTIYHEHVFYYSLTALTQLFGRHGLEILDVERLTIHGGTIRMFVGHATKRTPTEVIKDLLVREGDLGVATASYYSDFAQRVERLKEETIGRLSDLRSQGRRIAAYGAAAKGTVLCNHLGIDESLVDYVVDRSPYKQGRLVPGVDLPIRDVAVLLEERPDDVLILAWNFADEIIDQQREYLDAGGRFIVPIPTFRSVPE